jgi:hypothetical protein
MGDTNMIEVIANALTGEVVELQLSAERIAEIEADRLAIAQILEDKSAARASALAKLAALGLTEEEIAAL